MIVLLFSIVLGWSVQLDERVDLIELNHFHDENGKPVYDQIITYEYDPASGDNLTRQWRLYDPKDGLGSLPREHHADGTVRVRWFDKDENVFREVKSKLFKESYTQFDPERENKKLLDEKNRTALRHGNPIHNTK